MENPPIVKVVPDKRAPYERVAQVLAAAQRSRVQALSVAPIADSQ
jgi:biopolymer transport protein ExbD